MVWAMSMAAMCRSAMVFVALEGARLLSMLRPWLEAGCCECFRIYPNSATGDRAQAFHGQEDRPLKTPRGKMGSLAVQTRGSWGRQKGMNKREADKEVRKDKHISDQGAQR